MDVGVVGAERSTASDSSRGRQNVSGDMNNSDFAIRDILTQALGDFDNFSTNISSNRLFGIEAVPPTPVATTTDNRPFQFSAASAANTTHTDGAHTKPPDRSKERRSGSKTSKGRTKAAEGRSSSTLNGSSSSSAAHKVIRPPLVGLTKGKDTKVPSDFSKTKLLTVPKEAKLTPLEIPSLLHEPLPPKTGILTQCSEGFTTPPISPMKAIKSMQMVKTPISAIKSSEFTFNGNDKSCDDKSSAEKSSKKQTIKPRNILDEPCASSSTKPKQTPSLPNSRQLIEQDLELSEEDGESSDDDMEGVHSDAVPSVRCDTGNTAAADGDACVDPWSLDYIFGNDPPASTAGNAAASSSAERPSAPAKKETTNGVTKSAHKSQSKAKKLKQKSGDVRDALSTGKQEEAVSTDVSKKKRRSAESILRHQTVSPLLSPIPDFPPLTYKAPHQQPSLKCTLNLSNLQPTQMDSLLALTKVHEITDGCGVERAHSAAVDLDDVPLSQRRAKIPQDDDVDEIKNDHVDSSSVASNASASEKGGKPKHIKLAPNSPCHKDSESKIEQATGDVQSHSKGAKGIDRKKLIRETKEEDTCNCNVQLELPTSSPELELPQLVEAKTETPATDEEKSLVKKSSQKRPIALVNPSVASTSAVEAKIPRVSRPNEADLEQEQAPKTPTGADDDLKPRVAAKLEGEDRLLSADYYQGQKARPLKHKADKQADKLKRTLLYLESVVYFVMSIRALERQVSTSLAVRPQTMVKHTYGMLKDITTRFVDHRSFDLPSLAQQLKSKIQGLSLKAQTILAYRLYHTKQSTCVQNYRAINDLSRQLHQQQQQQLSSANAGGTAPSSGGMSQRSTTSECSQRLPRNPSLTPSPASSSGSSSHAPPPPPPLSSSGVAQSTVAIPQALDGLYRQQLSYLHHLMWSNIHWEEAQKISVSLNDKDFFDHLDCLCGPLRMDSSLADLSVYLLTGVQWIRALCS